MHNCLWNIYDVQGKQGLLLGNGAFKDKSSEYAIKYAVFDWKLDVFEIGHFGWIGVDQYPVLFPN